MVGPPPLSGCVDCCRWIVFLVLCFFFLLFIVKVLGAKNEATLFEQFPVCKKRDVVDLKMLAEYLLVREEQFCIREWVRCDSVVDLGSA